MMDGDGALAHFPRDGGLSKQPSYDMLVYRIIRHEHVRLMNEKLKPTDQRGVVGGKRR